MRMRRSASWYLNIGIFQLQYSGLSTPSLTQPCLSYKDVFFRISFLNMDICSGIWRSVVLPETVSSLLLEGFDVLLKGPKGREGDDGEDEARGPHLSRPLR